MAIPLKSFIFNYVSWHTNPDMIRESLTRRQGQCRQCGKCCSFFGVTCPMLTSDNSCRIYRFRPKVLCRLPPLDIHPEQVEKHRDLECGFYFSRPKADDHPVVPAAPARPARGELEGQRPD